VDDGWIVGLLGRETDRYEDIQVGIQRDNQTDTETERHVQTVARGLLQLCG
jgi:hypothetical protein